MSRGNVMQDASNNSGQDMSFGKQGNVVLLPCQPHQFRDFIAGLLGRPQTITRRINIPFEITREDINNIHHLLLQRIESQNAGNLISLAIDIFYSDNSKVTLNSLDDFIAYAEVKPLICQGITINWIWLIQFKNKDAPEKQDITISFMSENGFHSTNDLIVSDLYRAKIGRDGIHIRIAHTDRSWGSDIDSLLNAACETVTQPTSAWKVFFRKYSFLFGLLFGSTFATLLSISVEAYTTSMSVKHLNIEKDKWKHLSVQDGMMDQLSYISNSIAHSNSFTSVLTMALYIAAISGGIFVGVHSVEVIGKIKPSFVLLTKQTHLLKERLLTEEKNSLLRLIGGLAASLLIAITSKVCATWIVGNWMP